MGFKRLISVLAACIVVPVVLPVGVLSGCQTPAAQPSEDLIFEEHEVVTGTAMRQTVLPGFFLGGAIAQVAVVNTEENGDRRLRLYAHGVVPPLPEGQGTGLDELLAQRLGEGRWAAVLDATLGPEVQFVDVADIGGRDRLILFEAGRLSWFDPGAATERTLVELAATYTATSQDEIPHIDITRDLNRDGRDDLVLPDLDGFWISTQRSDGSFTEPLKMGPPEPFLDEIVPGEGRSYRELGITVQTLPWYLSRVHQMDQDLDGRSDLVFWNRDHFEVHLQDESGRFDPVPRPFRTDVEFDSDGAYSSLFEFNDEGVFSILLGVGKKSRQTVLHSVRDLNGDRIADLVTLTLSGRTIASQRSVYNVHFGRSTPAGVAFARRAGTSIEPEGEAGGMQAWGYSAQWLEDFDGDGHVDILFRDVPTGFGGMVRTLVARSVPMNLELYRIEEGSHPEKPSTRIRIRPDFDLFGDGVFFPAVLTGDVNGDGRVDLVVGKGQEELQVFLGVSGPGLLAERPRRVAVTLPHDERRTWLSDLNKDGKDDVLIHHSSTREPHRLTMLIAR